MTRTPVSLLDRLRQPVEQSQAAWSRFVDLYSPLLFSWGRQVGLADTDAVDLVQDVFAILVQKMPTFVYDRHGSFRAWLKTVTHNKWRENQRRAAAHRETDAPVPDLPAPNSESFWDGEYRQHVINQALRVMETDFEPKTWQACWQLVVEGRPAAEVAAELSLSVGTIYAAKCRVLARLRQELAGLLD
ncbi:MAG: sigma-70 family RNA polymerase sigma factor [Gemmataceae bacterium]|nr:sigma-70 family RNA polymerase sigma factor [Gemmataceae bacterium]